ncbi:amyloid fiber anchoring/assembly protein TapA [Oceanobacillus picturae]|uniref:amyloid fiber anchoring/assembly protein TapA n=1 Tax=Oceanobacillus picturae TaxID=171693 RepID=UPI00073DA77C|nr:amyloid fiber anchoring/assembly protein TapA [Oceanobacillus picturae]
MLRMSRMRKFKRYKQFVMVWKVLAICYISVFTLGYLASGTGAYFVSSQENEQVIQAGTWWDGSELAFVGKPTVDEKACPAMNVSVELKNKGFSMTGTTTYEVFFSETGNPQKTGKKVASGEIKTLEKGEKVSLTYTAEKEGFYVFKALQHPLYGEETEKPLEVWSKKVNAKCKEKKVKEESDKEVEQKKDEDISTEDNKKEESNNTTDDRQEKTKPETEKATVEEEKDTSSTEENIQETDASEAESEEQEVKEEKQTEKQTEKQPEKKQQEQSDGTDKQSTGTKEEEGE